MKQNQTNKIRKENNKQNSILAEQLILLQKNQEIESKKLNSFIDPLIIWTGGQYNNEKAECKFTNDGGSITNIKVVPLANFAADIHPNNILRTGEVCKIIFSEYPNPYPEKLPFEIHYKNKIGRKGVKKFFLLPYEGKFIEDLGDKN